MLRERGRRQDRGCDAALHVRDAAPVEPPIVDHSAERWNGPAEILADGKGVEMPVEAKPAARRPAIDHRHEVANARCALVNLHLSAGDRTQKLLRHFRGRSDVAWWIGGCRGNQALRNLHKRASPFRYVRREIGSPLARRGFIDGQGAAPRCGSPSPGASRSGNIPPR